MTILSIGKGLTIDVDMTRFPNNVRDHYFTLAIKNALLDSHAGITVKEYGDDAPKLSRAIAEKKLVALYDGDVRTGAAGVRAPRDAIGAIVHRLARAELIIAITAKSPSFKIGNVKSDTQKAWFKGKLDAHIARNIDSLRERAEAELAATKDMAADIDSDDMPE